MNVTKMRLFLFKITLQQHKISTYSFRVPRECQDSDIRRASDKDYVSSIALRWVFRCCSDKKARTDRS